MTVIKPKNLLPVVSWSTIARNVIKLTAINDFTYKLTVLPELITEPGQGEKEIDYYCVDFLGHLYTIIAVDGNDITVNDDFEVGYGPRVDRPTIIFKSMGDGSAQWLPPIKYEILDKSAKSYLETIINEILYRNKGDVGILVYPTDFTTNAVTHDFKFPYKIAPKGRSNIKVFRQDQPAYEGASELRDAELLWHTLIVDNEHFELTIDASESLTGAQVYFNFNSAT